MLEKARRREGGGEGREQVNVCGEKKDVAIYL